MTRILTLYDAGAGVLSRQAGEILPLAARLVFGAVLAGYFWASALTKLDGPFTPAVGAYAQIFPRALEAAGYNPSALGLWHWLVVMAGTYAEFLLPALLILGAGTRLAAVGMMGFILVQSLTDIIGHGADAATIGAWFDRVPDALILDQRALWMLPLLALAVHGGGVFSVDRLLLSSRRYLPKPAV